MLPFTAAVQTGFTIFYPMEKSLRLVDQPPNPSCPVTGLPDFPAIVPENTVLILKSLVAAYHAGIENIMAAGNAPDWSFVEAEIEWSDAIDRAWSPVSHLNSVADDDRLREAYNEGLILLTEHQTWRQQHKGIYGVYKGLQQSPGFNQLSADKQRIIELELRDFHLAGVDLDETNRAKYREIVLRLSELGTRFQENLMDATRGWELPIDDVSMLAGLPDAELRTLAENARASKQDGWLIDLNSPSYSAIITYAENRQLRQQVYTAYVTRASGQGPNAGQWDNSPVIDELLALRHQLAKVLGFENYVDYALSTRMADSSSTLIGFLDGLASKALPKAREQMNDLQGFADTQGANHSLEAWDLPFWAERYKQAELQLSDEQLKPYFPLESMLSALFHITGRVFGISLERDTRVPAWHKDVQFFWLHNSDGERCAGVYMDLFARKDKRGGAWMDVCRSRRKRDDGLQLPVAYLNCNFPSATKTHPGLLTHRDVETLFHEFGHCLHHMLTEVEWPQINGINNVEWDAVELPSQLLENWCWEEHLLDGFARHYQSNEPLPVELKERLMRSHHFHKALMMVKQLEYAVCDLRLHLQFDPKQPRDPMEVLTEVRREYSVINAPDFNRFLNGFSHIFGGGYSAGYYSYLWAEQLAADAWERFLQEGAFNSETGQSLRNEIYSVGGSRPAMESFEAFRGRKPEPGPLLRSYGLVK
jgi:oligopeptidase A